MCSDNPDFAFFHPTEWLSHTCVYLCSELTWRDDKLSLSSNIYAVQVRLAISSSTESVLTVTLSPAMLSQLSFSFSFCLILITVIPFSLCAQNVCKLQKVQNNAARQIWWHISDPSCSTLASCRNPHSVQNYYSYLKSLSNQAPSYLRDFSQFHVPSRQLRSSADTQLLSLPSAHLVFWSTCLLLLNTITLEQSTPLSPTIFFYQTPLLWNNLPHSLRQSSSIAAFNSAPKTHVFSSGLLNALPVCV